jgi:hypothetical protein
MRSDIRDRIDWFAMLFYIQHLLNIVNVIMDDDYKLVFYVCILIHYLIREA